MKQPLQLSRLRIIILQQEGSFMNRSSCVYSCRSYQTRKSEPISLLVIFSYNVPCFKLTVTLPPKEWINSKHLVCLISNIVLEEQNEFTYAFTWSLEGLYIGIVNVMLTGPASFVIFPIFNQQKPQKLGLD